MMLLDMNQIYTLLVTLALLQTLRTEPIEKYRAQSSVFKKPPKLHIAVPKEVERHNIWGDANVPDPEGGASNAMLIYRRDQVCVSHAIQACTDKCVALDETCFCASNGKTYRNQCEMACMRRIDLQMINFQHFGQCESPCPAERIERYTDLVKMLMTTRYLSEHVRRCAKITNCNQAKAVIRYTRSGTQSILQCPQEILAYFLFTGLDCSDFVDTELRRVLNNEEVISCNSAKRVKNRLFNNKNCALNSEGPSEKELIQWSFDLLDGNADRQLEESELDRISEFIPDQQCGEAFFTHCDADTDGFIREDEWSMCLGCTDCYRPCFVFESKRLAFDRARRHIQSVVSCQADGSCASKQCETQWGRHKLCWCVDEACSEVDGSRSYIAPKCD